MPTHRVGDPKYIRGLATVYDTSAGYLAKCGQLSPAMEAYKNAIRVDPSYDLPYYNLAWILATCPDQRISDPQKAVRLAERGRGLTVIPESGHLKIVAEVYLAAGRIDEAVTAAEEAIRLAEIADQRELARGLRSWLESFPKGSSSNASRR